MGPRPICLPILAQLYAITWPKRINTGPRPACSPRSARHQREARAVVSPFTLHDHIMPSRPIARQSRLLTTCSKLALHSSYSERKLALQLTFIFPCVYSSQQLYSMPACTDTAPSRSNRPWLPQSFFCTHAYSYNSLHEDHVSPSVYFLAL